MAKNEVDNDTPATEARRDSPRDARRAYASTLAEKIIANMEKVIIGKRPQITLALVAYLCEGHILLEDVPGVAKERWLRVQADSMYPRLAADRRHGRIGVQPEERRIRIPSRPDIRPDAAGRRDQPGNATDAVGA